MSISSRPAINQDILYGSIQQLLPKIGEARISSVAYDTAWIARLAGYYQDDTFENALTWIRQHQQIDGTWGGAVQHNHDHFISTLAAIVTLAEVGHDSRDKRRVQRGADALWRLVGKLHTDDSDTVGFPILSTSLTAEAVVLGLEVPRTPVRYAAPYQKKVAAMLNHPNPKWPEHPISFSMEGLRSVIAGGGNFLVGNGSLGTSPSATAALLIAHPNDAAMAYVQHAADFQGDGGFPAVAPIDTFEIAWSLLHLRRAGAISPDDPDVRKSLDILWDVWCSRQSVGFSTYFSSDLDDTSASFIALSWGGYNVSADVFASFEHSDGFSCIPGETNPSTSAYIRLITALRCASDHPNYEAWIAKSVRALRAADENGNFWWDKWHCSPYYVNSNAVYALHGIADDLALSRLNWILKTQNDDGGWGYYERSTPEETAYCLEALLFWDRQVKRLDPSRLDNATQYLMPYLNAPAYVPLWIGKSLYSPHNVVSAAIQSALFSYAMKD